jgi:hypothetical protein
VSAESGLDAAVAKLKVELREMEQQLATARAGQLEALRAVSALYNLRYDLKKPVEHEPTREALRLAELALYGK